MFADSHYLLKIQFRDLHNICKQQHQIASARIIHHSKSNFDRTVMEACSIIKENFGIKYKGSIEETLGKLTVTLLT